MEFPFGAYFISGIDTECGKTYVTARLASYLRHRGISVITQKPIQTGCEMVADDLVEHRKVMGCSALPEDREGRTCTYLFKLPASPKLAAQQENKTIDLEKINDDTKYLLSRYNIVLIEGAGGLMVPLTNRYMTIDYIAEKRLPLLLVASGRLGGINHALLSIDACLNRGIDLRSVIFNRYGEESAENGKLLADDALSEITAFAREAYPHIDIVDFRSSDSFWGAEESTTMYF